MADSMKQARERVEQLSELHRAALAAFDKIVADAEDGTDSWAALQALEADLTRARATLAAMERAQASGTLNTTARQRERRQREAEKAFARCEALALRWEQRMYESAELWREVEQAWRAFEAANPGGELFGSVVRSPAVFQRVMKRFELITLGRPQGTVDRIEPLAAIFPRKRTGVLSWLKGDAR